MTVFFAREGETAVWSVGTMAEVIAAHDAPVCIMHNRPEAVYRDFLQDVMEDWEDSVEIGRRAGISQDKMILDPGVGFAKTYEQNLEILAHLETLRAAKQPLLLAASRKSVIGLTLDLPTGEREEGTIVTSVLAGMAGWDMVRVHDVEKNVRALRMLERIQGEK